MTEHEDDERSDDDASRLRPELAPLPPRMQQLPRDHRGYPVPWFVQWLDAKQQPVSATTPGAVAEFRIMDQNKWVRAVRERRCWVCGDILGAYQTFVIGPMCGINRTTAEPPCHLDCAEWSARNCPFLARPHMVRRDNDGLMERSREHVAGKMLERNPGVTLLWTTKRYTIWRDEKGAPLITIGDPTAVRWYAEGRPARRAEIITSVEGGLPVLRQLAEQQDRNEHDTQAVQELQRQVVRFEALYPPE